MFPNQDPRFKTGYVSPNGVITPLARISYPNLLAPQEPTAQNGLKAAEYNLVLLFDKTADFTHLRKIAEEALVKKWGADQAQWPAGLKLPFRDQGEKKKEGYEPGSKFITVKANIQHKPFVVDGAGREILDPVLIYAGCYGWAQVHAYAYDQKGNRGVKFGLDGFQKVLDGEPLVARVQVQPGFAPVAAAAQEGAASAAPATGAAAGNSAASIWG
ncbi:MAG TPA: ssDNA-binding protein [Solimonas sp.]|nr:ssDNA-binding protein [Solimonas sp.]